MRNSTLAIVVVLGTLVATGARAEVPDLIPVQGVLSDGGGELVEGDVEIGFAIYGAEDATSALWAETQTIAVDRGFFTAYLGDVTALPVEVLGASTELWLGVTVAGDEEMNRMRFASVPFALFCRDALGDIHPGSVSVGGDVVINADGQWVGDPTGLVGPQGEIGPQGDPGEDGVSVTATTLAPGDVVCEYGGTMFTGVDGDTYACNGAPGAIGPQGDQGLQGIQGPQGDQGPIGPQGPQGDQGPVGPAGLACWDLNGNGVCDLPAEDGNTDNQCTALDCQGSMTAPVLSCTQVSHESYTDSASATCPPGYTLTGGGCIVTSGAQDALWNSYPNGNTWYCLEGNTTGVVAYAVCCRLQ